MKAAVYREHNKDPRKVVKIEEIEIPKIKHNQVLIKVEATSYNEYIIIVSCVFIENSINDELFFSLHYNMIQYFFPYS